MKLATFSPTAVDAAHGAEPRLGALSADGEKMLDLAAAAVRFNHDPAPFADMLAWLDAGQAAQDTTRELLDLTSFDIASQDIAAGEPDSALVFPTDGLRLLAPLPTPRSIRDCLSFERHLIQATRTVIKWRSPFLAACDAWKEKLTGSPLFGAPRAWRERPIYYKGNPHSVVGHEADVVWPAFTEKLDFELEFAIVIGQSGKNIPESRAGRHIAGFLIFNDFSARDLQMREMAGRLGPAKSKDFDTGNAFGPWLVTPDEIVDPYNLAMRARVNGELWTDATSAEMHFRFEEIIAYISRDETLFPGEVIGSGTAPGGCGLELDRWLQPGDIVELEVEGLGLLRNRIVRPSGEEP